GREELFDDPVESGSIAGERPYYDVLGVAEGALRLDGDRRLAVLPGIEPLADGHPVGTAEEGDVGEPVGSLPDQCSPRGVEERGGLGDEITGRPPGRAFEDVLDRPAGRVHRG